MSDDQVVMATVARMHVESVRKTLQRTIVERGPLITIDEEVATLGVS